MCTLTCMWAVGGWGAREGGGGTLLDGTDGGWAAFPPVHYGHVTFSAAAAAPHEPSMGPQYVGANAAHLFACTCAWVAAASVCVSLSLSLFLSVAICAMGVLASPSLTRLIACVSLTESPFGNYFFWFGMLLGIPMLCVLYAREHYGLPPLDVGAMGTFLGTCFAFIGVIGLLNLVLKRKPAPAPAAAAAAVAHGK
jgi:hypothetical protein